MKVTQSGDEPQIFLRAGVAPVGIGADRFETGKLLQERFGVDVLILDDGFQHVRLERQVDIVLIDALAPFGGGEVFPAGPPARAADAARARRCHRHHAQRMRARALTICNCGLRRYNTQCAHISRAHCA